MSNTFEEFLNTLKIHNKYIDGCFNDALAVRYILKAHKEALAEAKKEGFDVGYKTAGGDVIPLEIVELTPTAGGDDKSE